MKIHAITVIVVFFTISSTNAKLETINPKDVVDGPTWTALRDAYIGKNNEIVYVVCDDESNDSNCTLTINEIDSKGQVHTKECFVTLHSGDQNKTLSPLWVRSVKGNKVLLTCTSASKDDNEHFEGDLIYGMIDFQTCKFKEHRLNIKRMNARDRETTLFFDMNFIQYDDGSYDIFIPNGDLCNAARCKYHYNIDGKTNGPVPYLPKEYALDKIYIFGDWKQDKSFAFIAHQFYKGVNNRELRILDVSPEGHKEIQYLDNRKRLFAADDSNNKFSYCWTDAENATSVHCKQHNADGVPTMDRIVDLPYGVKTLRVKNLKNKNLLMLTEDLSEKFYMSSVKQEKSQDRSVVIEDPELKSRPPFAENINLSEDKEQNVCLFITIIGWSTEPRPFQYFRKCIPKRQLGIL